MFKRKMKFLDFARITIIVLALAALALAPVLVAAHPAISMASVEGMNLAFDLPERPQYTDLCSGQADLDKCDPIIINSYAWNG